MNLIIVKLFTYNSRIPKITNAYPIEFKCVQFLIERSFTISFNKAQQQTLEVVGIINTDFPLLMATIMLLAPM